MRHNFKDITGKRFNSLTVVRYDHTDKNQRGATVWLVRCDCGTEKLLLKSSIISGRLKSCGCMQYKTGYRVSREDYAITQIINSYKSNCKKEWILTREQCVVFFKSLCFYCGNMGKSVYRHSGCNFQYTGIDRLNNDLGYFKENCVSCCIICNRAKNKLTKEQFINYISSLITKNIVECGKIINKIWGTETILVNESVYCSKFLKINPGFKCSFHKHLVKKESFTVIVGDVILETKTENGYKKEILTKGESRMICPGVFHRFSSVLGALMLETSTHHSDEDVYRLEESGKIDV